VSVTLTLELLTNTLLASQQQACTAVAYVTMQLFGSQAQRAANIQNVMAKHLRVACSTVWDAYMGSAHSEARYISSLDFLSSMPKGVVFFFLSFHSIRAVQIHDSNHCSLLLHSLVQP